MTERILGGVYWNCSAAFNRGVLPHLSRAVKALNNDTSVMIEYEYDEDMSAPPRMG